MISIAQPLTSSSDFQCERIERASVARDWLTLWLPMIVIGIALIMLEHRWAYATEAYWNQGREIDLVAEAGGSNLLRQISLAALGAMGALLLLAQSKSSNGINSWMMALIMGICALVVLSALWAEDSFQSLKRSAIPVLTIVAALGVGKHWQPRQLCLAMVTLTMAFLVVGVAAACVAGTFLPTTDYRFTGTLHPNVQGVNCAALCLASLVLFWTSHSERTKSRNWQWLVPLFIGLAFLILTRSRTATMGLLAAMLVLLMFGASRRVKAWVAFGGLFVVAAIGVLSLDSDPNSHGPVYSLVQMGREQDSSELSTLTGRIPIWNQVLTDLAERPFLGYGYGGFWTPTIVLRYSHIGNWEFNHAHSAYLETMLGIGIVGLLLGLLIAASTTVLAMREYWRTNDAGFLFIVAMIVFALVHGVLDTSFVSAGFASLLVMICISIVMFQGNQSAQH